MSATYRLRRSNRGDVAEILTGLLLDRPAKTCLKIASFCQAMASDCYFALLKFVDFVLFCGHIGDQRLFSFGDSVDLEALDMTLLLFDDFIDPLGISVNNLLAAS